MLKKVVVFSILIIIFTYFRPFRSEAAFDCLKITTSSYQSEKDYCKDELAQIEKELADLLELQKQQQQQTGTLTGDVNYLTSQINALKAKVKARSLAIAQLKVSITEKVNKIESLSDKIEREHESLAQLLRNTNQFDNENIVHLILSDDSISNFYSDLESYASIKQAVKASTDVIRGIKTETEVAKTDLEKKQDAETDAKAELEDAQKKVAQSEAEKKQLLAISKQTEAAYQKLASEKKARADRIRSALFPLTNTTQRIEFGTALEYANEAKDKFGIDPAFLLAIFTQESSLGANVGLCLLTDPVTGNGKGANTGGFQMRVMHPTRDVPVFLDITSKLGVDYTQTRVSCWQPFYVTAKDPSDPKGKRTIQVPSGWGGAMGPAQFIPSTWKIFENRLKNMLGYEANPWTPRDAFMASAMYLTDLGAIGTSASAQNTAACRYYGSGLDKKGTYAGISCSYSRSVMSLKYTIQANIDLLNN